jgi:hypothetical protein
VPKKKIWANFQRIIELFTQKIVNKLSKIWVWDPRSGIRKKPIPGVKKAPDPGSGSATLVSRSRSHNYELRLRLLFIYQSIEEILKRKKIMFAEEFFKINTISVNCDSCHFQINLISCLS